MGKYDSNYEVPPVSRRDLRSYAKRLREQLGVNTPYFPIIPFLEALQSLGIGYDIVDDNEWIREFGSDKHAEYNLADHIIYIKQEIYDRAVNDKGRDRFTIAHEIAHALLLDGHSICVARRSPNSALPIYKNPEWQADCLAGELLIPCHLCKGMSIAQIVDQCKVSYDSARMQKSKF